MAKKDTTTTTWQQYQDGIAYKNTINLYRTVDENQRFYDGDQWYGIKAPNMPKPVFNFIEPACRFATVQVKDHKITGKYITEGEREDVMAILGQMGDYAGRTWARLKMEGKNLEGLTDAFNTGDYILYHWWDDEEETGQPFKGDVNSMIIDNVNCYPGNPNSSDIQSQPYIILAMRKMLDDVKAEAKKNGAPKSVIDMITEDEEVNYMSGDSAKYELEGSKKVNVLLKMWKEGEGRDKQVYFSKSTENVEFMKKTKAKLKLYPIAMMNWKPRKNSFHGTAQTTFMKANQVYLNKQMAFTQLHLLQTAYPKVIYSKAMIPDGWSNKVAAAVGVNGGSIDGAARYMNPPVLPTDVWVGFEKTLQHTMELMGVNDAAMGNITNPNNKAAFVAVRDAAIVPLEAPQQRFHDMMRQVYIIYMDMWINHYPEDRTIVMEDPQTGQPVEIPFDMNLYSDMVIDARVEVGESQLWSELNVVQTLDNLLSQQIITPSQYFQRMPDGYIPKKEDLVRDAQAMEQQQQQMAEAQAIAQQGIPQP